MRWIVSGMMAIPWGRIEMPKLILSLLTGFMVTTSALAGPLGDAAKIGDVAEIEQLLASGLDANEADPVASPLHWAAMNGHAAAVKLLADNGGKLDAESSMLGAPLHAAARFGRVNAINALLAAGADPDIQDGNDYTPLMRAVVENRLGAIEALLFSGADVDAVGNIPETRFGRGPKGPTIALHLAISLGKTEIAGMLEAAGAGPFPQDAPDQPLGDGDPERGLDLVKFHCGGACHMFDANDPSRPAEDYFGPPLTGIIGRPVADVPEYEYSEALRAHGGIWTAERVYAFALTPMLAAPGTRMDWAPDQTPEMVADITAFFVSLAE
jgi:cytochrome c2